MRLLLAVGFVVCWSSGFIGAKLGADEAPAVTVLMWRFLPLAVLLGAVAAVLARRAWRGLGLRRLGREVGIGLLSQSSYVLTVFLAIELGVSSGTTALIDGTQPLVVGALAGPLLREHVSGRQWVGLCLGLAGVGVVTAADAGANPGVPGWAYAVPFLGMLGLVAATFLDRRARRATPPLVALTVHCACSAVLFTLLAVGLGVAVPPATGSFWFAVGWLIVLATFGGYGLYWWILRRDGVTRVNVLMFLMAPVTAVWGAAAFGEPLGWRTVLGLALGLSAVIVVGWSPVRGNSPAGRSRTVSAPRRARAPDRAGLPREDRHAHHRDHPVGHAGRRRGTADLP